MSAIVTARGLGKQYRRRWALQDCTLEIPVGRVTGLVGPNGAGKTTLLSLMVGILTPTVGTIEVCGGRPAADSAQLAKVGFVAQDTPTYAGLTVAEHLRLGAHLNPRWDDAAARRRIDRLGLDPRQKAGQPLRRPARPARADARAGEAAGAAGPRRAGREPGPAGPARVPAGAHGGGRRGRDQRAALLARRLRPRARLRPRRRPGRLPGPGRRRRRGAARDAPPAVRAAPRPGHVAGRPARRLGQPHRSSVHVRRTHGVADPRSGLVRHAPGARRPRPGLHGGHRRPSAPASPALEVLR